MNNNIESKSNFLMVNRRGSSRVSRIWTAVQSNAPGPPMDARFMLKPKSRVSGDGATASIVSYLQSLYDSVAETLPDIRDDPGVETSLDTGALKDVDSYSAELTENKGAVVKMKTRKRKMSLKLHPERHPDVSGAEVRYLPPGVMRDYWETMQSSGHGNASFKTFWEVWHVEFPHLRFRPTSSHAQCSTCLHHKLLIRELCHHVAARRKQSNLLVEHLAAQYRDRLSYWAMRGSSRLHYHTNLVVIVDGMDQCKFSYPRSVLFRGKDLSTMVRPKLHIIGILAHGWGLCFAISGHDFPKDSSVMTELLANLLTRLAADGVRLQMCNLHLQSDNTSREIKNSTLMRFLSALVSHNILASATMAQLRSGHSHEDIDQVFGSLALFIVRHCREAQTPADFTSVIDRFCTGAVRPHEKKRLVYLLDAHRDWIHGLACNPNELSHDLV